VKFANGEAAKLAVERMNNKEVEGNHLRVDLKKIWK
jgi:RNA recognition motif-containing protein